MSDLEKTRVDVKVGQDEFVPKFCNIVEVGCTETEFIIKFMYVDTQSKTGQIVAHIATTPTHFQAIIKALENNLKVFKERYKDNFLKDAIK